VLSKIEILSVNINEAQTALPRLIARIEASEKIISTHGDLSVARPEPIAAPVDLRKPGRLKGLIGIDDRFFEPLPDEELKAWEG
jgi:antitoxin (DNA-binding transcriptional repressor) of toxin-antitoxin stability system